MSGTLKGVIKVTVKRIRRRFLAVFATVVLCFAVLAGCDTVPTTQSVTESSLYISKEGKVTAVLIESFGKEYYSRAELEELIHTEVQEYNREAGYAVEDKDAAVKLTEVVTQEAGLSENGGETHIAVRMEYATVQDYAKFNGVVLFYGTVEQAYQEGYSIDSDMITVDTQEKITKTQIKADGNRKILIMEENLLVSLPENILMVGIGMSVKGDTQAKNEDASGYSYIITK